MAAVKPEPWLRALITTTTTTTTNNNNNNNNISSLVTSDNGQYPKYQSNLLNHTVVKTHEFELTNFDIFFSVALRPHAGHGFIILEVSRTHTTTHHTR
jgi:hypothetical protein